MPKRPGIYTPPQACAFSADFGLRPCAPPRVPRDEDPDPIPDAPFAPMERAILVNDPIIEGSRSTNFHAPGLADSDRRESRLAPPPEGRKYPWYGPSRDLDPEALHGQGRRRDAIEARNDNGIAYSLIGANRKGPFRHAQLRSPDELRPEDVYHADPAHGVRSEALPPHNPSAESQTAGQCSRARGCEFGGATRVDRSFRAASPPICMELRRRAPDPEEERRMRHVTIKKFDGGCVAPTKSRIPLWEADAIREAALPYGTEVATPRPATIGDGGRHTARALQDDDDGGDAPPAGVPSSRSAIARSRRIQRYSDDAEADAVDTSLYQATFKPPAAAHSTKGKRPLNETGTPIVDAPRYAVPTVMRGSDHLYRSRHEGSGDPFWFGGGGA